MTWYAVEDVAERAGVEPSYVARLVDLGILAPEEPDRFSPGDVRRVLMARSLEDAGIPLDGVAAAIQRGVLSLEFFDADEYERFAGLAPETFRQVSDRTGIPLELLTVIREAIGMAEPSPDDRLREDEMAIVPFIELQVAEGFRPAAIERLLRVEGDSTRRIAEQEAAWWTSEVIERALAAGEGPEEIGGAELTDRVAPLAERSVLAMYHAHQARNWTSNIVEGFEVLIGEGGDPQPPRAAPGDLLPGYHGLHATDSGARRRCGRRPRDDAHAAGAAELRAARRQAHQVARRRRDVLFADPGPGVRAALEMVDALADAGLPPAHVGLHAGPVLYQEGDYYGQTVNLSARIADYARPGEVLVSQAVTDASQEEGIAFADIGPVELKGVSGTVHLLRAHRD